MKLTFPLPEGGKNQQEASRGQALESGSAISRAQGIIKERKKGKKKASSPRT